MKALTLWQPWASFMLALPAPPKAIETRPRNMRYRGPLAIHVAKTEPAWVREAFCEVGYLSDTVRRFLCRPGQPVADALEGLPRGCVLGQVTVIDCVPTVELIPLTRTIGLSELALGDYAAGRYAIFTRDPVRLSTPVPFLGRQGLWTLPDDVWRQAALGGVHG